MTSQCQLLMVSTILNDLSIAPPSLPAAAAIKLETGRKIDE